jgi:hypothetical protein
MNTTYVFLVSDKKKIWTTLDKPAGVTITGTTWKERITFEIGEAVTVYTDDVWDGTIGVYDVSRVEHVLALAKNMHEHSLALAERRIEAEVHDLFGDEASIEVQGYMWASSAHKQQNYVWSPMGGLLWRVCQAMKRICFQEQ